MREHVAQMANPVAFTGGKVQPVADGISVVVGRRHGSRTDEGIEYRFDAERISEDDARAWIASKGIQVLSFTASPGHVQADDGTWAMTIDVLRMGKANASRGGKVVIDEQFLSEVERYTNANIDTLKPPLKLGHQPPPGSMFTADGAPALGWVARVRRVGDKLVADVVKVPDKLYQAFQLGRWRRQSAEIMRDWTNPAGDKVTRVLKAVALLGSELPAIQTLDDLVSFSGDEQVVCFVDAAAAPADGQGEGQNGEVAMTPEEIKAFIAEAVAKAVADALAPRETEPEGDTGMTDEETKTMTGLREQITDLRLTAALNARKITPAEIAKQKPLIMTLTADQANQVLDTIDAREPGPDKTQPIASTRGAEQDPLASLEGEEKLIALANGLCKTEDLSFRDAWIKVGNENPDDYAKYRKVAFPTRDSQKEN